jgi:hypothetical protein
MDQVSIKYTNIFHSKTLQNFPKFGFLVWKQTIWQPCWMLVSWDKQTAVHMPKLDSENIIFPLIKP